MSINEHRSTNNERQRSNDEATLGASMIEEDMENDSTGVVGFVLV